jgi:hypothetical protein
MIWVLVPVIVVPLAVVGLLLVRQRRSRQLKQDFGPEYRRTVAEHGDQRAAEKELTDRRRRVEKFEIRPLDSASRERYSERWSATQRHFVDEPAAAVDDAHTLVQEVMHDRGYPAEEDFEQRAADVSVEHPNVVENYRAAHQISLQARNGGVSTEQLRQSMVHFRALFDDLLSRDDEQQTSERQTTDEPDQASQPARPGRATVSDWSIRRG